MIDLFFSTFNFFAATARAVDINPNLPGSYPVSTYGPAGAVANFYQFALMMGGLLAFGVIVWGGIRYTLASGNPSTQSDARDQITQALLGLLLLVGVYLVLTIINPNLTKLGLPTLPALQVPTSPTDSTGCGSASSGTLCPCGGHINGACAANQTCVNKGDSVNPNYQCVSNTSFTCGGEPPNSHYGDCPPPQNCVNDNGGTTPSTVRYACHS